MKKALVTGATGFIGSNVVKLLAEKNIDVLVIVRNTEKAKSLFGAFSNVRIIKCEMENYMRIPELIPDRDVDITFHFAWDGTSGESRKDYRKQLENVVGLCDLLRAVKQIDCQRIVCAGSIMESEVIEATRLQDTPSAPANVYSAAKCVSHQMAKAVANEVGIDLVWGIITNAYGPGEVSARFINTTLRKILNREPLAFTSGTQNYDFIYISDLAQAFLAIGEKGKANCEYVLGSGHACPLKNFILEMQAVLAPELELSFGTAPFVGISLPLNAYSTKKLEEDTGFHAKVPFSEGIRLTMDWISSER